MQGNPGPVSPIYPPGPLREMAMKRKKRLPKVKSAPTFWSLIEDCFPPPYNEIYLNPELVYKTAKAALPVRTMKLGPGYRSLDYEARCAIHTAAVKINQESPEMRAPAIAKQPEIRRITGKNYHIIKKGTAEKWIREVVKHKPGRPKG